MSLSNCKTQKFPEDIEMVGGETRSQTKREQQRVTKKAGNE